MAQEGSNPPPKAPPPSDAAVAFEQAFEVELECVLKSRGPRAVEPSGAKVSGDSARERAKNARLVGLALSGGGIRSATLNLGLLQALAELDLLRYVDYLSTVSGGGYIGSWLHGWIRQEKALETVREHLSPKESPDPQSAATRPIRWLRQHSNYLSPRPGLFSVDTWTIAAVWTRNTLLNLLVLIPVLCALLLLPRVLAHLPRLLLSAGGEVTSGFLLPLGCGAALLGLVLAAHLIRTNLKSDERAGGFARSQLGIHLGVCGSLFLSALGITTWLGGGTDFGVGGHLSWLNQLPHLTSWCGPSELFVGGAVFLVLASLLFALSWEYVAAGERVRTAIRLLGCFPPALVGATLLVALMNVLASIDRTDRPWHLATIGVPGILFIYSLVVVLHLGLLGRDLGDQHREWWSRLCALVTIYMLAWCALFGAAIYGPLLLAWLVNLAYGSYVASGLGVGWLATTIAGAVTARGGSVSGRKGGWAEILAKSAPTVFVVGLVLLLSLGIHLALIQVPAGTFGVGRGAVAGQRTGLRTLVDSGHRLAIGHASGSAGAQVQVADLECLKTCGLPTAHQLQACHYQLLLGRTRLSLFALIVCALLACLVGARVDVNEFSMHHFYRNRLVRCYLGASRNRKVNFFTGFDPEDDFSVSELVNEENECSGPYPIINTALNVVKGEELAWQERKAESFVFTPLFGGFEATSTNRKNPSLSCCGYRPTKPFAFPPKGIHIGNATAISGAAASPNMGYHTSPTTAFLMTLFNVRLGWWIGNPRHATSWRRPGPTMGLFQLLCELTASTDDESKYLYLSDGGHFENLGIYELVRRRCRYIIASDCGCDPGLSFEDLGNAIRKCRADFGVEIEIDCGDIRRGAGESRGKAHCAVGTVRYTDGTVGTLVYIKSSLTGDEPTDVLEYAVRHGEFPHQTTGDQFFDESQFESYRKLGYHMGTSVLREIVQRRTAALEREGGDPKVSGSIGSDRDRFFSDLREFWYASSPNVASSFTRHAEVLTKLMRQLREDEALAFLDEQISPEWERLMQGLRPPLSSGLGLPSSYQERRIGFHFCNSLMQFMEDVYLDLNLEGEAAHPDNAGWINLFKHWSWSAMFRVTWAISEGCYGSRFRNFCRHRLGLGLDALGTITVDEARDVNDPQLNFREREILAAKVGPPDGATSDWQPLFTPGKDTLFLLQVSVRAPDPQDRQQALAQLTFGIAVVDSEGYLVYLRVQDHLRRMGLARRAIDKLAQLSREGRAAINGIRRREFPKDFPERVEDDNKRCVERTFNAVGVGGRSEGPAPSEGESRA